MRSLDLEFLLVPLFLGHIDTLNLLVAKLGRGALDTATRLKLGRLALVLE